MRGSFALVIAVSSVVPLIGVAQPRPVPKPQVGVTLPSPPPARLPRLEVRHERMESWSRGNRYDPWGRYPIVYSAVAPAAAPQVVQVPVYVPVPVAGTRPEPRPAPAPVPYDPTKARLLTIGGGADGGAGVMRLKRLAPDSLEVTWLGHIRPVRTARFFLATDAQTPFATKDVTVEEPTTVLRLVPKAAFAGLMTVFADGSVATTLIPAKEFPAVDAVQRPGR